MIKKHHARNHTMVDLANRYAGRGVVWLAINSGGPGQQGTGVERNQRAIREFGLPFPVLLDTTGAVGHAYGARTTPHMFVIDAHGTLVYQGAIDDDPGRAVGKTNYVANALDEVLAGQPVATPETRSYG
jgi:hypothetical protein